MSIAEIAKKGVAYVAKNPREVEKYFNSVAGVLGAAAILIDRAKPLLDEVDTDAVVDMAKQAANNVADGVQAFANKAGEGANAAANGINAAAGALGNAVKTPRRTPLMLARQSTRRDSRFSIVLQPSFR